MTRWQGMGMLAVLLAGGCAGTVDSASGNDQDESFGGKGSSERTPPNGSGAPATGSSGAVSAPDSTAPAPGAADAGVSDGASTSPRSGPLPCELKIIPVSPPRFLDLLAGEGERLRVRAQVSDTMPPSPPVWKWSVRHEGVVEVGVRQIGDDPAAIEFDLQSRGRYFIHAEVSPTCAATEVATAFRPGERLLTYWMRITPPRDSGLPPQETSVRVGGGVVPVKDIALQSGYPVIIDPQDAARDAIRSFIRITSVQSTLRFEGRNDLLGFETALDPLLSYDVLVIPEKDHYAPALFRRLRPTQIAAQPFTFEHGTLVRGRLLVGTDSPVAGARVLLRAGPLPSTLGASRADGAFELRARPEAFTALVLPPPDSGLPEAHLPTGQRLTVGTTSLDLELRWRPPASGRLEIQVAGAGGGPLIRPARVRLESVPGALPDVGTFQIGPDQRFIAEGVVRLEGTTSDGGLATFARLPGARYSLTIVPGTTADGTVTTIEHESTAGTARVTLARPIAIAGRLEPAALGAGISVVAMDASPVVPGEVLRTTADGSGQFQLVAAPGRTYRLFTEPLPERQLPRLFLGTVRTTTEDLTFEPYTLHPGLPLAGAVTFTMQDGRVAPVPGTVIQVFCTGKPPECVDPDNGPASDSARPVGETVTDARGRYELYVPDPAKGNL
jgi:hypothetical protein